MTAVLRQRDVRFEPVFDAPIPHPNGLQASDEGLWIADERQGWAYLVNFQDGKVIRSFATGAGLSSGITYGGGALWMCSNGLPIEREICPSDTKHVRIVKSDPNNGNSLAEFLMPDDDDCHGIEWTAEGLWLTSVDRQKHVLVNRNDFTVIREVPLPSTRAHGIATEGLGVWCVHTTDRMVIKLDSSDGTLYERIDVPAKEFEPHGLTCWEGILWSCDAVTGTVYRIVRG